MNVKRIIITVYIVALLLPLAGCWSSTEISKLAIVMAIGVDATDDPTENDITVQIVNPSILKKGGGSQDSGSSNKGGNEADSRTYVNYTRSGHGVQQPLHEFEELLSRDMYTGHAELIVIGQDAARAGLDDILDYFNRTSEARLNIALVIARGRASDLLEVKPSLEQLPVMRIMGIIDAQRTDTVTNRTTIADFMCDVLSDTAAPTIPIVAVTNDGVPYLDGCAVFSGTHMTGELTEQETRNMLAVSNRYESGIEVCNYNGGSITFEVIKCRTKTIPQYENGQFSILLENYTVCRASELTVDLDIVTDAGRTYAEELIKTAGTRDMVSTIRRAQQLGSDVFGFGEAINRRYPSESKQLLENWDTEFALLPITVNCCVLLYSTGAVNDRVVGRSVS